MQSVVHVAKRPPQSTFATSIATAGAMAFAAIGSPPISISMASVAAARVVNKLAAAWAAAGGTTMWNATSTDPAVIESMTISSSTTALPPPRAAAIAVLKPDSSSMRSELPSSTTAATSSTGTGNVIADRTSITCRKYMCLISPVRNHLPLRRIGLASTVLHAFSLS